MKGIRNILSVYHWRLPKTLIALLQHHNYKVVPYVQTFWHTENFNDFDDAIVYRPSFPARMLTGLYRIGSTVQIALAGWLIYQWHAHDYVGGWAFGLALLLITPLIWAHVLCLAVWAGRLTRPKQLGKAILCRILEAQVKQLRSRHSFKVVAIAGSVGKTSTKAAVAKTLEAGKRVLWQTGNYNDRLTVPLVFFGHTLPGLFNLPAWIKVWLHNARALRREYPYDIVVIEIGTDGPGQIEAFAYLQPEIVIITAITPEHMEYFGTLDAVADEELTAMDFAQKTLVNVDDTPGEYLKKREYSSYGLSPSATYYAGKRTQNGLKGQEMTVYLGKKHKFQVTVPMLGVQGAKIAVAAAATAHLLGESNEDIEKGLKTIEPFAGRMRLFKGIKKSTLIDDTYNASPIAVNAALDVLYATPAKQRIAILGSMNELGEYARDAHNEVGTHCDPRKLDLVVTIGADARDYLAPIAEQQGCKVKVCMNPYEAGEYVRKHLKNEAVVLAKGSQNGVFAEEALKELLANKNDSTAFVRQSPYWLDVKRQQFADTYKEY